MKVAVYRPMVVLYLVESDNRNPRSRCFFPLIFDSFKVSVKESLQVVRGLLGVEIMPFMSSMNA